MHKILVIRLYFLLDALHVSDRISPSSGATFISCTSHLVYVVCCVAIATKQTTYTKCDVQFLKVAPEDGLVQSETCRASNG